MMGHLVLGGDVGGMKTHLGVYHAVDARLELQRDRVYASRDFHGLEDILKDFISGIGKISAACFGVPGPVVGGVSHPFNLPWTIKDTVLSETLNGATVRLLNDVEAAAYGTQYIAQRDTVVLQQGEIRRGRFNKAVISAGTGLGEAGLVATPSGYFAVACEGGHCDFAPRGTEQEAMLEFLSREYKHVSFERLLSGLGIVNIHRFLTSRLHHRNPEWLSERLAIEDQSAVIGDVALRDRDRCCSQTLELFAEIYAAEAANLALKFFAIGGVYLSGAIAPKILPFLTTKDRFSRAFCDKGRLRSTLQKIEVRVCLNQSLSLNGTAHFAAAMIEDF